MSTRVLHLLTCVGLKLLVALALATDPWLQPRFYSTMIGPPGSTKTAVDKELRRVLFPIGTPGSGYTIPLLPTPPLSTEIEVELSINSGPALVQALDEHNRILIAPDELSGLVEKARQTTNSPNSFIRRTASPL